MDESEPTVRVEGEAVGMKADRDLRQLMLLPPRKHAERVLATAGREYEVPFLRDQITGHATQARNGVKKAPRRAVDSVQGVVDGVRHAQAIGGEVNGGVAESSRSAVLRELDKPHKPKERRGAHCVRATCRRHHAYTAS